MKAGELVDRIGDGVSLIGGNPEICGISADSRLVHAGCVFAAIKGYAGDGAEYIDEALRRGAVAVLSEGRHGGAGCLLKADNARWAYARAAAVLNGEPSRMMRVAGVTGTNGKTTVAHMMRAVLEDCGRCGLLGTIAYEFGGRRIVASHTTPDAAVLQGLLRQMVDAGCEAVVMEVSSHALDQSRTASVDFDVAIFTNLTHEHLDYHGGMDGYYEAKAGLFRGLKPEAVAVINADDEWGRRLLDEPLACRKISYGINCAADYVAVELELDGCGSRFVLRAEGREFAVVTRLMGRHNVSNALAAIAAARGVGLAFEGVLDVLRGMSPVPGRLQLVESAGGEFQVYIDYAHTPDALGHALRAVREITSGRVIVVFGCGGDRDRRKRPEMGRIGAELADVAIITSDNPRCEDPAAIIDEIIAGAVGGGAGVERCDDRREAIALALAKAGAGDSVLVAGKGHEDYQEVGGRRIRFDDREVVLELLKR